MKKLQKNEFEESVKYVCKTFFPRWNRRNNWKIVYDPTLSAHGLCDIEKKIISIKFCPNGDEFLLLLIHEICHTHNSRHNKKWYCRMLEKAEIAKKIGKRDLAERLHSQVEQYKSQPFKQFPSASFIYENIADWTLEAPHISYEKIIEKVAQSWGMYPEELKKDYTRAKKVWEKAQKDAKYR